MVIMSMWSAPQVVFPSSLSFSFSSYRKGLYSVSTSDFSHSATRVKLTMKTIVSNRNIPQKAFHYFSLRRREDGAISGRRLSEDESKLLPTPSCWANAAPEPGMSSSLLWWHDAALVPRLKWQVTQRDRGRAADGCDSKFCYVPTDACKTLKSCTHISYSYSKTCEETLTSAWGACGISPFFSNPVPPCGPAVHGVNGPLWLWEEWGKRRLWQVLVYLPGEGPVL